MTREELEARGVIVRLERGRLVIGGQLDDALRAVIVAHRERLATELRGEICRYCKHWWRQADDTGDCLRHNFATLERDDCGGWQARSEVA